MVSDPLTPIPEPTAFDVAAPAQSRPEPPPPAPPMPPPVSEHWQLSLTANTGLGPDVDRDSLINLLREIINRIEDGFENDEIQHIAQSTQITLTGEPADIDTLRDLAPSRGRHHRRPSVLDVVQRCTRSPSAFQVCWSIAETPWNVQWW